MKIVTKNLLIGGVAILIAGAGLKPSLILAKTETPVEQHFVKNSTKVASSQKNQFQLLNPGTGARQQLRFKPKVNAQQAIVMTMDMDMAMSVSGQPVPTFKSPGMAITLQAKVTKVDSNGDIHYEFSYTNVDVVGNSNLPPQVLQAMQSKIKELSRIKGSGIVDSRGNNKKLNLSIPQDLDPYMKQTLQQMSKSFEELSTPVPQEAVGLGAQWRVASNLNINGMNLKQIATYELVNLKDGVATLALNVEQQVPASQKIDIPGMPPGNTFTIKSYTGTGQGETTVMLNKVLPIRSTMNVRNSLEMVGKTPNSPEETTINQKLSMKLSTTSK
ncbi:DUF6263 family protein [Scytonema sp. NUACC21]